ncbi:DUF3284 domain-containing protein [uncultured Vagococcus sp.]|uniref:DUF3284 domain-containing protein n=1 Tax=uncultured Vagococcus sp. TaxID=189676 RepID=UPI0028D2FEE1|nr:DUF3284 domain-containing protein [uncultured Vagococcus sp.]
MRVDTLKYSYVMNAEPSRVYQSLLDEQYKFFKRYQTSLTGLAVGTQISKVFQTKTQKVGVPGTITILQLIDKQLFQMETAYAAGTILQTYELVEKVDGKTEVSYWERNSFIENRHQYSFMLIGLIYKLAYNKGIKKRLQYIEGLAQQKVLSH